ncbi:MAG: hypothetical protein NC040_07970 [Muribaculaceae bacterium]|nr:hypothetical protein [Alistipes senegalensis]MCM1473981.1 hypothetical protein [Muribaculaceae bacterium]
MKRKTRTITVNGKKYVWWWGISNYTTSLFLSPDGDKTSVIRVDFTDKCINGQFNMGVTVRKDGTEKTVIIIEPAMSGLILPYIQEQAMFIPRKNIFIDGCDLLRKMGYEVIGIKKGLCW